MVACRKPKTRSAAEGSSPSASAESTMAICCEGVFKRYRAVLRLGSEGGAACLTAKRLDRFSAAMLAISHQSMDGSVCDPEVQALQVGTSEAVDVHPLGYSPAAFDLTPRSHGR